MRWQIAAVSLALLGARPGAASDSAILQLQVLEGEGAIYTAGARAGRPIAVLVTDETGGPVVGAAVSFRLPDQEVTGMFATGMKHDVVVTGRDGRAWVRAIQWGRFPGPVVIRVTAAKEQARAGTVINCFIGESASRSSGEPVVRRSRGVPWKWIAVAGGGAAIGAVGFALGGGTGAAAPSAAAAATVARVQVGIPTFTVGPPP